MSTMNVGHTEVTNLSKEGIMKSNISLVPSDRFIVTDIEDAVKLRTGNGIPNNYDPVTVPQLLNDAAADAGYLPALRIRRRGQLEVWTFKEYRRDVRTVAKAMLKYGLQEGHGVCIIGINTPEWFFTNLGAIFAGGIPVGIYPTSSPEAVRYILDHCRCNIVFVDNEDQLAKVNQVKSKLPNLKCIVMFEGKPSDPDVISWKDFTDKGKDDALEEELEISLSKIAANKCGLIVYTSGTTGDPKGVMLSHDNITFTSRITGETFGLIERETRIVSYLPLSHVAAIICDLYMAITFRATITFADKNALKGTLTDTLRDARPTTFVGVPRVFEKIQEKMLAASKNSKGVKKIVGSWAKETGLKYNKNLIQSPNQKNSVSYKIADKLVFQNVKALLGLDKCWGLISMGAPMSTATLEYFMSLDILIMEWYGLSETSGVVSGNLLNRRKLGTVGKNFPSCSIKILPDGEICMKGRVIMMGYLKNQKATEEIFLEDGWLKSGDIGEYDSDGFLLITGRRKELIITAGGENIPPIPIENHLKEILPLLSNVMIVGDRRKFLSGLLTLKVSMDPETQEPSDDLNQESLEWCKSVGSKAQKVSEIIDTSDEKVLTGIQDGINKYNKMAVSNAQKVQKWIVVPKDFSKNSGELGDTLKMKRHVISKKYNNLIEKLYA